MTCQKSLWLLRKSCCFSVSLATWVMVLGCKLTINVVASVMSFLFGWSQWQRAMAVRKILQEIVEKHPRFHNPTPLKTKHVVHWCRCHGYTPPDPETLRNEEDSIEDVLTQIDSEPGECGGTGSSFLPETLFIKCLCMSTPGEGDSCFLWFHLIHSGITKLGDGKGRPASGAIPCPCESWYLSEASLDFYCALGPLEAQCRWISWKMILAPLNAVIYKWIHKVSIGSNDISALG